VATVEPEGPVGRGDEEAELQISHGGEETRDSSRHAVETRRSVPLEPQLLCCPPIPGTLSKRCAERADGAQGAAADAGDPGRGVRVHSRESGICRVGAGRQPRFRVLGSVDPVPYARLFACAGRRWIAMKRSARLKVQREAVERFRDDLKALVDVAHRVPAGLAVYYWRGRPGLEEEFDVRKAAVAHSAGAAAEAADVAGLMLHLQPPPVTGEPAVRINPIRTWFTALDPPNDLMMDTVIDYCEQVIGTLRGREQEARSVEQSLAGRVAQLVGFPNEVRSAIRLSHG
jgi:hypothetical protein